MATINDPAYLKAASFHTLSDTAYGLLDTYTPSAVMMYVSQELPVSTSMALTEASVVVPAIKASMSDIRYLSPLSFIKKSWAPVQTSSLVI